jgi:hypothetical protein
MNEVESHVQLCDSICASSDMAMHLWFHMISSVIKDYDLYSFNSMRYKKSYIWQRVEVSMAVGIFFTGKRNQRFALLFHIIIHITLHVRVVVQAVAKHYFLVDQQMQRQHCLMRQ